MKYSKIINFFKTPQSQPIPDSDQKPNNAGGFAWEVDRWNLLDRFLILGSESGTYYVGAQQLTAQHAENVLELIKEDGERVVLRATEISVEGRAPKNDPAIYVLALCASFGSDQTRGAAFAALPKVCRTGTHLFAFTEACSTMRGWGRGMRKAVGRWFNSQPVEQLAYGLVKYQSRNKWSSRDLLRLSHPVPATEAHRDLYKWVVSGELPSEAQADQADGLDLLRSFIKLKGIADVSEAAELIREKRLPREAVPTELLREAEVWRALSEEMPLTALIRNLGVMSKLGVLTDSSSETRRAVSDITNIRKLKKARVHPLTLLTALLTYSEGRGRQGSGEWPVIARIVDALDSAFYLSFANVEATGKRVVLGLDVSGSMAGTMVNGTAGLDCRRACAAMALVTNSVEDSVTHLAFDTHIHPLAISKRQRLDDVTRLLEQTGGGGTDCSAPIVYAREHRIPADVFVIYTDSETWFGEEHPAQAMARYRKVMGIPAKLVVVAMASNRVSVADPGDPETLNVVGFDTSVPQLINEFVRGGK